MSKPSIFKQVNQIGLVTNNPEKMVKMYEDLFNIGPFSILDRKDQPAVYNGKDILFSTKTALARFGTLQIEINYIYEGETPHTEWIRRKGEGFHHFGIFVDDLDEAVKKIESFGFKSFFSGGVMGIQFVYIDTESAFGFPYEVIQLKKKKKK